MIIVRLENIIPMDAHCINFWTSKNSRMIKCFAKERNFRRKGKLSIAVFRSASSFDSLLLKLFCVLNFSLRRCEQKDVILKNERENGVQMKTKYKTASRL